MSLHSIYSINSIIEEFKSVTPSEWIGFWTGLIEVVLLIRNKIWNWHWGLVSAIAYVWVFYKTELFSSMWLQLAYFVPMQIYGWWIWKTTGPLHDDDLPITWLSPVKRLIWFALGAAISLSLGWVMSHTRAKMDYPDATIFGFSIVAQYLQARKIFENWILWIGVDLLAVYVYAPSLPPTAILYAVFVAMGFYGAKQWLVIMKSEAAPRST